MFPVSVLMQRIFTYGDIQNTNLTPDKELNNLIYRTPFCHRMQELQTSKNDPLSWPTLYCCQQLFSRMKKR